MVNNRAYLQDARTGTGLDAVNAEVMRLVRHFGQHAQPIEPTALLPADILIDLYGENIRSRAYTTFDPIEGELMLRPDFTVPVVQMHMQSGQTAANYVYAGPVWRRQIPGSQRPNEYLQVGYESFGLTNEPQAEAAIFALFAESFDGVDLVPVIGDVSLIFAVITAMETTEARKAALRRHVWRPARFQRLLSRFSNVEIPTKSREKVLNATDPQDVRLLIENAGDYVGLRSLDEIISRQRTLKIEAETPRLTAAELAMITQTLELKCSIADAPRQFAKIAPSLSDVCENLAARADALADQGLDPSALAFDTSYGVSTMEYYDGFVFGFAAANRPDLPHIAVGGRYDALTEILGQRTPAIGGIVRPEALLALKGRV